MADYDIRFLKFLVVDDDRNMGHLVATILKSFGVTTVKTATSAEQAYAMLGAFRADIVICDLRMAPEDGIQFTRRLRNDDDSPDPYVPIIMLTGHAELTAVESARDAGVHEFLAKPVSAKKFYEKIHSVIDHERQFIRSPHYVGPDRRRRQDPAYHGPERRQGRTSPIENNPESGD